MVGTPTHTAEEGGETMSSQIVIRIKLGGLHFEALAPSLLLWHILRAAEFCDLRQLLLELVKEARVRSIEAVPMPTGEAPIPALHKGPTTWAHRSDGWTGR